MKTLRFAKMLSLALALPLALGLAGCDLEDLLGELAPGGMGGLNDEAPISCQILRAYTGVYDVVGEPTEDMHRGEPTASHTTGVISIKNDLSIVYDTGISFGAADLEECYDRRSQDHDRRIQASYGVDDNGPVINLYLDEANRVVEIQYRNLDEGVNMRSLVSR